MRVRGKWNASTQRVEFEYATRLECDVTLELYRIYTYVYIPIAKCLIMLYHMAGKFGELSMTKIILISHVIITLMAKSVHFPTQI